MLPNKHVEARSKGGKLLPHVLEVFFVLAAPAMLLVKGELFSGPGAGSTAQLLLTCLNSHPFSLRQTRWSGVSFFKNTPDIFCPLRHVQALGKYCFTQIKMVLVSKVTVCDDHGSQDTAGGHHLQTLKWTWSGAGWYCWVDYGLQW